MLDSGDDDPLSDIDMTSRPHHFAVWHGRDSASVSSLSAPAAIFLAALLQGRAASSAFTGSTSGIGLGIANALAVSGANVVLNGLGDAIAVALMVASHPSKNG